MVKRFGIEGMNSGISGLEYLIELAAEQGVENIVLGMAHRGRLSALHSIIEKPMQLLFQEFLEKNKPGKVHLKEMGGDVKYHLGYTSQRNIKGKDMVLQILFNPSHLEAVNPLVYGTTRALQERKGSTDK